MESLFIYGTLCDPQTRRKILRKTGRITPARLDHFIRRDGRWPYIMSQEGATLQGFILEPLTKLDMKRLDAYEDVTPHWFEGRLRCLYKREIVTVLTRGSDRKTWVYLPNLADWPLAWM